MQPGSHGLLTVFRPAVKDTLGKPKTRPFKAPDCAAELAIKSEVFVSTMSVYGHTNIVPWCVRLGRLVKRNVSCRILG
jgi:hypothetical protein